MGRRHSRGRLLTEFHEKRLQFVGAGNDDPDAQHVQFKQKAECREIAVKKWVLIVPFGLDRDAFLVIIDVVRGRERFNAISRHFDFKALFDPSSLKEKAIY